MKIQNYSKFKRAEAIQPTRVEIVIPAFVISTPTWAGASTLLAEFPLGNSDYLLSFKLPILEFGENFVPAIRWVVDGVIYRFKLWSNADAILFYPVYSGERIGLNAVLEIWSINSEDAPVLDVAETMYSSVLVFPDSCECCQMPSESITLVQSSPSVLPPYSFCNPFCNNLC